MRLHNFFIKGQGSLKVGDTVVITDPELVHQWGRVMRYETGDKVVLFANVPQEFHATITRLDKKEAHCTIEEIKDSLISSEVLARKKVCLCVSLLKKDKTEWVIQKGTELGVSRFILTISDRSEKTGVNMERLMKIAQEACEQSGRSIMPEIVGPCPLAEAIELTKESFRALLDIEAQNISAAQLREQSDVSCFIGPEGGWTEAETDLCIEHGIGTYSLGVQVLRAETASIGTASLILLGR